MAEAEQKNTASEKGRNMNMSDGIDAISIRFLTLILNSVASQANETMYMSPLTSDIPAKDA